ncbi:helix-turn-helix domain-containing protein [Marinivivus vitaminiproducens]|uniref:helix-turn-helix domain-containing protein n=1 Tax=Marinivivus vitaminiproducens TaxID=3035935 RepID=UPI00279F86B8|nr:helix-turn-helix transcriptional regulator [Geminicoccaceae bacterium SCSIO 64248]
MSNTPHPIDVHVGRQVKLRRTSIGMSQERLGELLDLTFQQVQKYERGANRIGSSRLYAISRILDVPVSFFFSDLDVPDGGLALPGLAEEAAAFDAGPPPARRDPQLERRETRELLGAYYRIADPDVRRRIFELVKSLASCASPGDNDGVQKSVR